MRVQIVDPPAYTPPYDHSLCTALARSGADVELVTSRFLHGPVPEPDGFQLSERFYRGSTGRGLGARGRYAQKAGEHLADMLRFRQGVDADVVHWQWTSLPWLDWLLMPRRAPQVLTAHASLRGSDREEVGWGYRRVFARMDAVVAFSEYGAAILRERVGVAPEKVHTIPHGPLDYLTQIRDPAPLPSELGETDRPVVLCFGIVRPYKGVDVLIEAFREVEDAELWVVGRPYELDLAVLQEQASQVGSRVRFVPRFIDDREVPSVFERADLVVLPYRAAEQSGVLYAALAFGKPIVMSAVGGFPEVAAEGAGVLVPPADPAALAQKINELLASSAERDRLAAGAQAATTGRYGWDAIAEQHLALYRELASG
jgi:glycosyltransferase involved in cell wall biosynthesis